MKKLFLLVSFVFIAMSLCVAQRCGICHERIVYTQQLGNHTRVITPCGHEFHAGCIIQFLATDPRLESGQRLSRECPLCRCTFSLNYFGRTRRRLALLRAIHLDIPVNVEDLLLQLPNEGRGDAIQAVVDDLYAGPLDDEGEYDMEIEEDEEDDVYSTVISILEEEQINDLRTLIEQEEIDVNYQYEYGGTLLMYAVYMGYEEAVQLLLEHNAYLEIQDAEGLTALHEAAINGHEQIVRMLLERWRNLQANARNFAHGRRFDPTAFTSRDYFIMKDSNGKTALHRAAAGGSIDVIRVLIEEWNRCAEQEIQEAQTAFSRGAECVARARWDIKNLTEIRDLRGRTALQAAGEQGYEDIVRLLLSRGATNWWYIAPQV